MLSMNVGMIGVGLMGHGIASNIVKHGHQLAVMDHPGNQPLDALKAAGVRSFAKACDVASSSDVVILVLTGSPQVETVLTGLDGVLSALRPGATVIDCSTALPSSTRRMAQAVHAAGGRFLDCPMTRTPREAAEGRLNLLVGGDAAVLEDCRALLRCFAENITHAGDVGAGHSMKLLHNFVSLGMVTLLAEAAACAEVHGVAADVFVDVLGQGGGGGTALERLRPYLLNKDASGLRFSISNAVKDIGYYDTMAQDAGAAHQVAEGVLRTLQRAASQAQPETPVPELVSLLARKPGAGAP
jgi:3-hydroxyisobutyrate dehydrogenase-like beta-hydroxyacid dehydrogenase